MVFLFCQINLSSFTLYISIDLYYISVYTYKCKEEHERKDKDENNP